MSTHQQTLEWMRKLGYDGDFPESFDKICNNSTSFIWDQLINNVRSKIEVGNIRNNILVHHLKQNGLNSNGPNKPQCFPQEISTYLKKKDLEQKITKINYSINEKQVLNQSLMKQNSIKKFTIEKLNLKIKENEEREFLLREKRKVLDTYVEEAENIYNFSMTCTPSEANETPNTDDITHTFKKCEELLEEKIKTLPLSGRNISCGSKYRSQLSVQKCGRKNNTFEHYLCLSERRTAKKMNVFQKTGTTSTHKVNVRLFTDDGDKIKAKQKKFIDMSNKRESLEMYIEDNDDENFLVDLSKASFLKPLPDFKQSCYRSMQDMNRSNINLEINNGALLKMIYNESVASYVTCLLHKYNRFSIWNVFRFLDDDIHFHISKKINFRDVKISSNGKQKSVDLTKLQALHIKTELKLLKNNIELKYLIEKVNEKNKSLNSTVLQCGYPSDLKDDLQKKLQLQVENAGLDTLLSVMKKEINDSQTSSKLTDIHELNKLLKELQEVVSSKTNDLTHYLTIIQELFSSIQCIRNISSMCVREVAPFTSDLTWCYLLQESINSSEIKIFEQFPIEHNRRFINTNPCMYYRDFHTNKYLLNQEINNENLNMLSFILGNPFNHPETVISNILCSKLKLEALKNIKPVVSRTPFKKHALRDLHSKECTVEAVEEFNKLICSSTSKKTLSAVDVSTNVVNIMNEMNFNQFISPNIKVDGKDYQYYKIMYDRFFSGL